MARFRVKLTSGPAKAEITVDALDELWARSKALNLARDGEIVWEGAPQAIKRWRSTERLLTF